MTSTSDEERTEDETATTSATATASVQAISETHLVHQSLADFDDAVINAASLRYVELFGTFERRNPRALACYFAAVVVGAIAVTPMFLILLMPHFWLIGGGIISEVLFRRALLAALAPYALSPTAARQLSSLLIGNGWKVLRPKQKMPIPFSMTARIADDRALVPEVKSVIARAQMTALQRQRRRGTWRFWPWR